jgi:maintenance of morphology protein 1
MPNTAEVKSLTDANDVAVEQPSVESIQRQLLSQYDDFLMLHRELFGDEALVPPSHPLLPTLSWNFAQGFIIGQVSVIFVIVVFIKFFVFADPSPSQTSTVDALGVIVKRERDEGSKDREDLAQDQPNQQELATKSILEKTYYDVKNHSPESLDWFNVLVAQTISQLRTEALLSDNIYHSLNSFLDSLTLPDYIDKIKLTEIDIGDDFPIFSNCRIKHSKDDRGRLEAKIDVDLADTLTLGIETKLLLNHPRPLTAVLPVQLSVSIVRFSGCLTVSLVNTNEQEFTDGNRAGTPAPETLSTPVNGTPLQSNGTSKMKTSTSTSTSTESTIEKETTGTALMFSFGPEYRFETNVKSLIGSRAKLQDVPKISSVIESRLRSWFRERCVEPRFQVVRLPSLWPRTKNTREPLHQEKDE